MFFFVTARFMTSGANQLVKPFPSSFKCYIFHKQAGKQKNAASHDDEDDLMQKKKAKTFIRVSIFCITSLQSG